MIFNYKYFFLVKFFIFNFVFSQSLQDIQKLKSEYENLKNQPNSTIPAQIDQNINQPNQDKFNILPLNSKNEDFSDNLSKHFGYSFFARKDTLTLWDNLPAPTNYVLGPGDEIIISIWGETQLRKSYIISKEGKIYDEKVGLLNLSGKSISDAKKYFLEKFGQIYETLKSNNPSSYLDVSLDRLKSINVNFVGEFNYPGIYPVHQFATIITALIQAGGIDTTGSLREISLKRRGDLVLKLDLYNYLINGEINQNIQLRDGDVILVPPRLSKIYIDSAVARPGIYESKNKETVNQMIKFAGGLNPNASTIIGLERIVPYDERNTKDILKENYYINFKNSKTVQVRNGDKVIVHKVFDFKREVEVVGQVKNPGKYYFYDKMRLMDLLRLAGGLEDTSFVKSINLSQAHLVRKNSNKRYEDVFKINLSKIDTNDFVNNPYLQNLDKFVIYSNINFFEKDDVVLTGEINIPGLYNLESDRETLSNIIKRAGGKTSKALKNGITIYRNPKYFQIEDLDSPEVQPELISDFKSPYDNSKNIDSEQKIRVSWKNYNIFIMPGDSIVVREATQTISIQGEVYNPGLVEFIKGKSLRYYINSAGGFTENANKEGVIIIHANGEVFPRRLLGMNRVTDGSTIIIHRKAQSDKFNVTQFATNWTSIVSSVITSIILTQQLSGN